MICPKCQQSDMVVKHEAPTFPAGEPNIPCWICQRCQIHWERNDA